LKISREHVGIFFLLVQWSVIDRSVIDAVGTHVDLITDILSHNHHDSPSVPGLFLFMVPSALYLCTDLKSGIWSSRTGPGTVNTRIMLVTFNVILSSIRNLLAWMKSLFWLLHKLFPLIQIKGSTGLSASYGHTSVSESSINHTVQPWVYLHLSLFSWHLATGSYAPRLAKTRTNSYLKIVMNNLLIKINVNK
jgi:hypothetical protein